MRYKGNNDLYVLEAQPMKAGGEGAIYGIESHPDLVAKIYHPDRLSSELEDKIIFMANNPPDRGIMNQIAWPQDTLRDAMGGFVGFVMPKLQIDTDLKAIYSYPPNPKIPITCEQKVIVAMNICIVISAIHKAGYVFGDFNPLNIGVNLKTGHVAFLDTDSYHITDTRTGKIYRCGVCLDGYVAPELIQRCKGTDFLSAPLPTFTQETDRFALAIHIFKLLMNGYTPFNGIKEGESASQASPGVGNLAIERDNYCFKPGNKPQSAATPDMSSLTPDLQYLFKKTFLGGANNPGQRATADEWLSALKEYKNNLIPCSKNSAHHYYINNSTCPYCDADAKYAQGMASSTSAYRSGATSSSQQVNFGQPVNIPSSSRTKTSNYAHQQTPPQKTKVKNKASGKTIGRILLWVFFFPIMLLITVCRSKMPLILKVLIVPTIFSFCLYAPIGIIGGVLGVIDYVQGEVKDANTVELQVDIEKLVTPLIVGYNNYGYFDSTQKTEESYISEETRYTYSLKFKEESLWFVLFVHKEETLLGTATIYVECNNYLSNDDLLKFRIGTQDINGYNLSLLNDKLLVSGLNTAEFIRNDPKEYFAPEQTRKSGSLWSDKRYWQKLGLSENEYVIENCIIRLSIIEDKRPGAESVNPGMEFHVYNQNDKLLASGKYYLDGVKYDADNDDYGPIETGFGDFVYLIADFDQAELLSKTGILFNNEERSYKWYS